MTTTKPRRRRWYTFSLRSLLIFTVIAGFGFGWLGLKVKEARDQRLAVEAIEKLEGAVFYDYQYDEQGIWISDAEPPAPRWLRQLLGDDLFCSVLSVVIEDQQFTDTGLIDVAGLTNLEDLNLSGTQVTDAGLAHLQRAALLGWDGR